MNEKFLEIDFEGIDTLFDEANEKIKELKCEIESLISFFESFSEIKNNAFEEFEKVLYKFGMTLFCGDSFRDENEVNIISFYDKIIPFLEKSEYVHTINIDKVIFSQIKMTKELTNLISKFREDIIKRKLSKDKEKIECLRNGIKYQKSKEYDNKVDEFMNTAEVKLCELANKKFPIDY